jgi:hypothetical protein
VKAVATPLLIGAASLAGRRWGHHVGGWLVALPLTSGPIAFFLAANHGADFAARSAVGMLAGTVSQIGFAVTYRGLVEHGRTLALVGGCAGYAAATIALSQLHWSALPTFALTAAALSIGIALTRRPRRPGRPSTTAPAVGVVDPPRWDIPVRMAVATGVVLAVTAHHIYGAHARHAQSACVTGPCEQPAIRPAVSSRVATRRVTTGRFVSWGGRGPNASSKATHSH